MFRTHLLFFICFIFTSCAPDQQQATSGVRSSAVVQQNSATTTNITALAGANTLSSTAVNKADTINSALRPFYYS